MLHAPPTYLLGRYPVTVAGGIPAANLTSLTQCWHDAGTENAGVNAFLLLDLFTRPAPLPVR